jgi:hypothetical protein
MKTSLLSVCAVTLVACGGGGTTDGGSTLDAGAVDAGTTNISLAGSLTQTLVGVAPTASFNVAPNGGQVTLVANTSTVQTSLSFGFAGPPTVGTYVGNDAGIDCNVLVNLPPPSLDGWMANRGSGIADLGTCSLTLSEVTLKSDVGTQRRYVVHGSVGATLPARSGGATGSITYSASF